MSAAFRHIHPSWRNYIRYVDLAARNGDEGMARYRDCYLSLTPLDQRNHWPEQMCELANVAPEDLVAVVCREIWKSHAAESSMISAIAQPMIVQRTAELAQGGVKNYRERELFFRLTGSLPDKKGASINIINNPVAQSGAVKLEGADGGVRLKSFDEEIIEMSRLDGAAPFLVKDEDSDV